MLIASSKVVRAMLGNTVPASSKRLKDEVILHLRSERTEWKLAPPLTKELDADFTNRNIVVISIVVTSLHPLESIDFAVGNQIATCMLHLSCRCDKMLLPSITLASNAI
ncbi:hypothetical protein Tco_0332565 [Tanacetum coccineum]